MKVIDLLNKIANGEEVPQLIKWNGYVYDKVGCEYFMLIDRGITLFGDILDTNGKYLNDEVEVIEEDKKIEPFTEKEMKVYHDMSAPIDDLVHKVSLIIDHINNGDDK